MQIYAINVVHQISINWLLKSLNHGHSLGDRGLRLLSLMMIGYDDTF